MRALKHVIQITDTHIGPGEDHAFSGSETFSPAQTLIDAINALDFTPDLVVHTGDVVDDPSPEAYRLAAAVLGELASPVYFVRGNHDGLGLLLEHFPMEERTPLLDAGDTLAYCVEAPDHTLYVLDGCVAGQEDGRGDLPSAQLEALRHSLASHELPFSVFIHHPPFGIDSPWIEEGMLLGNGEQLHEVLLEAGVGRGRGVFFGHIHSNARILRDGILYCGLASSCCQFTAGPSELEPRPQPDAPAFFNHITFLEGRAVIKIHTLPPGKGGRKSG